MHIVGGSDDCGDTIVKTWRARDAGYSWSGSPGDAVVVAETVAGNGSYGFSGDGGLATQAKLYFPEGVAVDNSGDVFIADTYNNRIRKVDTNGIITTVAGNGTIGLTGDGGPATSAELSEPNALVFDSSGNLFIADGFQIRKVATNGIITEFAHTGVEANGLAIDTAGNLYSGGQTFVSKVNTSGTVTTIAGNGTYGYSGDGGPATSAELFVVLGVAVDTSGNLYIDTESNFAGQIRKVATNGIITTIAGGASMGDGGPATHTQLAYPNSVAVDSAGNLYIVDAGGNGGLVRKIDTSGVITTVAGNGGGGDGDGGAATSTGIYSPNSIAVDGSGNLYIAGDSRIRKVDHQTGIITTVAGNGTDGSTGDGGPATSAEVEASGVAVDSAGNLYIADGGPGRVRKVDHQTGIISTVAGNGTSGSTGDGGPATSAEVEASGLAVDSTGNLYIAGAYHLQGDGRVRKVDHQTGIITTVAGNGTAGSTGDGGPATGAEVSPNSIAVDSTGNLYISELSQIRKVDHQTGIITTVAGNGTFGFSGDGGPATSAEFSEGPVKWDPNGGIAVDSAGSLYIADSGNDRIREVTWAS